MKVKVLKVHIIKQYWKGKSIRDSADSPNLIILIARGEVYLLTANHSQIGVQDFCQAADKEGKRIAIHP